MAGKEEKLDTTNLSKEGDKEFKKQMEEALYDAETVEKLRKGNEENKEWEELLQKIIESIKTDAAFREKVKKMAAAPEMSMQLRGHLLALVAVAESRDKSKKDAGTDRQAMAELLNANAATDAALEAYAADLMKNPDWKKKLLDEMDPKKSPGGMLKIMKINLNPDLKVAPELREFLNNLFAMVEDFTTSVAKVAEKLFPEGEKGPESFAKEIRNQPDWQNKIAESLKSSPEFRIKTVMVSTMSLVKPANYPSDLTDYLLTQQTQDFKKMVLQDTLKLSGFDGAKWQKLLGEEIVGSFFITKGIEASPVEGDAKAPAGQAEAKSPDRKSVV